MRPPNLLILFACLTHTFLFGQTAFTGTTIKTKGESIRLVKILTDDKMAPVLLVNESEKAETLTDWYIFLDNGGSIRLHKDDSLKFILGHAQLGQQYVEIQELGRESDGTYHWQITTPSDTLILGGFDPDENAGFSCLLYKQMNPHISSDVQSPVLFPGRKLIPLLKFSNIKARKGRLSVFETGQLSDYPYLAKIIGAFLATLKLSDRI